MLYPQAMFIEAAKDVLSRMSPEVYLAHAREFEEAMPGSTPQEQQAYVLGIATARVVIAVSAEVFTHGANPENIL